MINGTVQMLYYLRFLSNNGIIALYIAGYSCGDSDTFRETVLL